MSYIDKLNLVQQQLLLQHLDLVIQKNKSLNLTRINSRNEGKILHIEDSLSGLQYLSQTPLGLYGDLGSGAGYPGIPLAVASQRETILIEGKEKKATTLKNILKELKLDDQIKVFSGRAELLAKKEPESFSVLTARALAPLSTLTELASPLLKEGGYLICYKAKIKDPEIQHANKIKKLTGMKFESRHDFILDNKYTRTLFLYKKELTPQLRLPRKEGQAQKNPL